MPLSPEILAHVIAMLDAQSFQILCMWLLRDAGYDADIGPLQQGRTDGGLDIVGLHEDRRFVAHCTIQAGPSAKLRQKFLGDLRRSLGASPSFGEFVFCSIKRVGNLQQETDFKKTVVQLAIASVPQYAGRPPIVECLDAERIALRLTQSVHGQANAMLRGKLQTLLRDAANDLSSEDEDDGALGSYRSCHFDTFLTWVTDPAWLSDGARKGDLTAEVLEHLWTAIMFSPRNARRLESVVHSLSPVIAGVLLPLARVAQGHQLSETDVIRILDWLKMALEWPSMEPSALARAIDLFLTRLIRKVAYEHQQLTESDAVAAALASATSRTGHYWDVCWHDILIRHRCHYVTLGHAWQRVAEQRVASTPGSQALHRLSPYLFEEREMAARHSLMEVAQQLGDIGATCRSALEARWVISALIRFFPLFGDPESHGERSDAVRIVTSRIPLEVLTSSPLIRQWILLQPLLSFFSTRGLEDLKRFEQEFTRHRHALLPQQVASLQLHYASALELLARVDRSALMDTEFGRLIQHVPNVLSHGLLRNDAVGHSSALRAQPDATRPWEVSAWLESYAKGLFAAYHDRELQRRIASVTRYRIVASSFQSIQGRINHLATTELVNLRAAVPDIDPSAAARLIPATRYIHRGHHTDLLIELVQRALLADTPAVQRCAPDIAVALYHCRYYSTDEIRRMAIEACRRLVELTEVGRQPSRPYWAHCACVDYEARPVERDFCLAIEQVVEGSIEHALGSRSQVRTRVPDTALQVTRHYADVGSLFAAVLADNFLDAEAWNIIGTTTVLNASPGDLRAVRRAALFYSYGHSFALPGSGTKMKCAFNYLSAYARYLTAAGTSSEIEEFLQDALSFLGSHAAQRFAFRAERAEGFASLVTSRGMLLSSATRVRLEELRRRRPWVDDLCTVRETVAG